MRPLTSGRFAIGTLATGSCRQVYGCRGCCWSGLGGWGADGGRLLLQLVGCFRCTALSCHCATAYKTIIIIPFYLKIFYAECHSLENELIVCIFPLRSTTYKSICSVKICAKYNNSSTVGNYLTGYSNGESGIC